MVAKQLLTSEQENWGTPQWLYDLLNQTFKFDVDVCADDINHKCERYFTKETDGLSQTWDGCFWMNPPYGRTIRKWTRKAVDAIKTTAKTGVLLLPARTDTNWFVDLLPWADETVFLKGRLHFEMEGKNNAAPFPSVIMVLQNSNNKYYQEPYGDWYWNCDKRVSWWDFKNHAKDAILPWSR